MEAASDVMCELEKEVKQFVESKGGIKGLVDCAISKVPRIFIHSLEDRISLPQNYTTCLDDHDHHLQVPVIDMTDLIITEIRRKKMVDDIRNAAQTWGFFQIVNHGIPLAVMEEMIEGARRFHEQPQEVKKEWYSHDSSENKVHFYSNIALKPNIPGDWRDTLRCQSQEDEANSDSLPQACRREMSEYSKSMIQLRKVLSELLSEALGLDSDYIASMGCLNSVSLLCQYYPVCPEPHLTLGATKHADVSFLTILLQDTIGSLQILRDQTDWVDVKPVQGSLLVNIGDLMQLVSNDKMKSVEHRVLATQGNKARVSVACFLTPDDKLKSYGPIKELLSDSNPPLYKETSFKEFQTYTRSRGLDGSRSLPHFRLL